ncbi:MAG TPA: hypothetical protein VN371_01300 [Chlorobaculum sp.]|nr:hypothetical protein [Chlorobaculum sp.]
MQVRLVDKGNTVIIIEYNLDIIRNSDWVVDLGPEGGNGGGVIVAEGTPEEVTLNENPHTGRVLKIEMDSIATTIGGPQASARV